MTKTSKIKGAKFSGSAGIAIGPILFVIAILGVIAAYMASGSDGFQTASSADRITADIVSQANLIRSTINQCNMQYQTDMSIGSGSLAPATDPYPYGSALGTVTNVSLLNCDPDPKNYTTLWVDKLLPPPTGGFLAWQYVNGGASGGRCFWTSPDPAVYATPLNVAGVTTGLAKAASKFNSATTNTVAAEVMYNPTGASQKFAVWITLPTGTANANCAP